MGVQKKIRSLLHPILKPVFQWYLSKTRTYTFKGISIKINPTVFHPGLFLSTKLLLKFLLGYQLKNKRILELGAGTGLISFYCAKQGAIVTATDISSLALQLRWDLVGAAGVAGRAARVVGHHRPVGHQLGQGREGAGLHRRAEHEQRPSGRQVAADVVGDQVLALADARGLWGGHAAQTLTARRTLAGSDDDVDQLRRPDDHACGPAGRPAPGVRLGSASASRLQLVLGDVGATSSRAFTLPWTWTTAVTTPAPAAPRRRPATGARPPSAGGPAAPTSPRPCTARPATA